jgi:hypothetical protein
VAGQITVVPSLGFIARSRERLEGNTAAKVALARLRRRIEHQAPAPMSGRAITHPDRYDVAEREQVDSDSELLVRLEVRVDDEGDYTIVLAGGPRLEAPGGWAL